MPALSPVRFRLASALAALLGGAVPAAQATPALVVDVTTGDVLFQQQATQRWYPASLTKLMTVYVALDAVRAGRIAMDTPLVVSARAATMPPSRMGFAPGTQVTLDNALKMLMVRSANDVAVTIAEGVSGSVEAFAEDMNGAAATLGLRESHFVNPNGLPDPGHYSSARDMAVIARALYRGFPDHAGLFALNTLALGTELIPNHNNMLGRYPGADGMKTGFTCAAGFNVVASAFKDGRRLVAVIMGAPNVATRTSKAAALFDRGFAGIDQPQASIVALRSAEGPPPDMRNAVCRNRSKLVAQFNAEVDQLDAPLLATPAAAVAGGPMAMAPVINAMRPAPAQPVPVHVGAEPGYAGPVAQARAPHSAVGSEPDPSAAIAYAPQPTPVLANTPLSADPAALPLRGRGRAMRQPRKPRQPHAVAAAPVTKVIADADAGTKPARKAGAKPAAHDTEKAAEAKAAVAKGKAALAASRTSPKTAAKAPAKKSGEPQAAAAKAKPRKEAKGE